MEFPKLKDNSTRYIIFIMTQIIINYRLIVAKSETAIDYISKKR